MVRVHHNIVVNVSRMISWSYMWRSYVSGMIERVRGVH